MSMMVLCVMLSWLVSLWFDGSVVLGVSWLLRIVVISMCWIWFCRFDVDDCWNCWVYKVVGV